jgi:hypothetical protein
MSEYQYYEFQAIDRPLTEREIRELRSYSTRAKITPTRFLPRKLGNARADASSAQAGARAQDGEAIPGLGI